MAAGALGQLFRLSASSTSSQRSTCFRSIATLHRAPHRLPLHAHPTHSPAASGTQPRHMAAAATGSSGGLEFDPTSAPGAGATRSGGAGPSADAQDTAPGGGATGPPKLIIFGGNGFVGSRITEEATKSGLAVVSISRSGAPPANASPAWASQVEWARGDVFEPSTWQGQLSGAAGVISTLGGFGSNEFMYKICGESNMALMEAAAAAGVPRFVFVSVHDYKLPDFVGKGYFKGKRDAEARLAQLFPSGGVALRPGFMYGTRQVGSIGVPLQAVGLPLDKLLGALPSQSLANIPLVGLAAVPPASAEAVGRAAVAAATDPSVPAGLMDVWKIKRDYGSS